MRTIFYLNLKAFLKSIQPIFSITYSGIVEARILLYFLFSASILLTNCTGSKKFTSDEKENKKEIEEEYKSKSEFNSEIKSVRVLLDEKPNTLNFNVSNEAYLLNEDNKIAELNKGDNIQFVANSHKLNVKVGRKTTKVVIGKKKVR